MKPNILGIDGSGNQRLVLYAHFVACLISVLDLVHYSFRRFAEGLLKSIEAYYIRRQVFMQELLFSTKCCVGASMASGHTYKLDIGDIRPRATIAASFCSIACICSG